MERSTEESDQGFKSDVMIWGDTKVIFLFIYLFFFPLMQLIPCHRKSQLRRGSPYHSRSTAQEIIYCAYLSCLFVQPTAHITAYLTVILVNHNFKALRHVLSTHVLIFRLPPTLPDPQFFSPSSCSPSVWNYFMPH